MTVAEHLRRSAPELRIFDLPREQELYLRALLWKDIRGFNARLGPAQHFVGLEFSHFMEFSEAILGCKPSEGQRVLDIGGLQSPLGLYLAAKGCVVHVIDVDPAVQQQEQFAREAGMAHLLGQKKFVARRLDGRKTDYPDEFFDVIIALSTLDHTNEHADSEILQEASRLLRRGGLCCVSVGYGPRFAEGHQGRWPVRTYSEKELDSRLIQPVPQLGLLRKFYFGDDTVGLGRVWNRLPPFLKRWVFGWVVYAVGQATAAGDNSRKKTANRVCLLFQKGAESPTPGTPLPSVAPGKA